MDHFIDSVASTADAVGARLRDTKRIQLSFDEWNVWYLSRHRALAEVQPADDWRTAPRVIEDRYNVADAVVVGNMLISLLRHSDRVTAASQAQLANVIAPIMTEPGGPAWRQTIFHPFALTAASASGRVLRAEVAAPLQDTARYGGVPVVDAAVTHDEATGAAALFVVNRSVDQPVALDADLRGLADELRDLAAAHRDTPMAGRTLLQQALPTTFGAVAAGWANGLAEAADQLDRVLTGRLAVQLGGAVGTLASLGEDGPGVTAALAARLDLADPVLPWHTERGRIAELASALGRICGAAGTAAQDVVLLAQTEVGELVEDGGPGVGGSSTLPHKRNPVAAVSALACARQAPGLVANLLAAQIQEHQRAAGGWHAEWLPLTDLFRRTGGAVAWLRTSASRLRVVPGRMRANLGLTGGLALSERVTTDLAPELGRT
ncbi:alpha-L-arabinofuranosidase C-terminal domain-containing protein, partial [Nocardiopsis tropica]|nr:alpha-L-arabinofuranosidase C-terminal domain-containing protein [Nocardiopsis tropica]